MAKTKQRKTKKILQVFQEISAIPRCSKHEEQIGQWLLKWAATHRFEAEKDRAGNVLIRIPASKGYEKSTAVVIQGHLDMVCEKTTDSPHDFSKDPIEFVYDGEWLKANQTTLGADNGIAVAMAMVLALDKKILHPALELLFTVDEETGLTGANALGPGFLKGKFLLNVDSEDEGVFTIGCAGGRDTKTSLPLQYGPIGNGSRALRLKAGNMTGGHSGVNIQDERANAIKVLMRALGFIRQQCDLQILDISGGTAHNAIPRDAQAGILIPENQKKMVSDLVGRVALIFKNEFKKTDPNLALTVEDLAPLSGERAITRECSNQLLDLLLALPHGVAAWSTEMADLVETSNNLANIRIENEKLRILTSQRSSVMTRLDDLTWKIEATARLAGAQPESSGGYPSWQPNIHSPLLAKCRKVYKSLFRKEPKVEAIHAGLECGIIGDKYAGMDMISFGPTLKNPHSPDEKIHIPSIEKVWDFLVALLRSLK